MPTTPNKELRLSIATEDVSNLAGIVYTDGVGFVRIDAQGNRTTIGGGGGVSSVSATDGSIVVSGSAGSPTIATGTLDAIANAHPPAADVALNGHKLTGLASPSVSTDADTLGARTTAISALSGVYDALGAAASAQSASQPLDSDLTAIAALVTTSYGRGLLTLANAAAADFLAKTTYDPAAIAQQVAGTTATQTLTNKRITPRTGTTTSSATPTINTDNVNFYSITALAAAITSFTTNLSGTPTENQTLWIAITDNGTARTISWGASFEASTVALPTTTVISTRMDIGFVWNTVTSKWRCIGVV